MVVEWLRATLGVVTDGPNARMYARCVLMLPAQHAASVVALLPPLLPQNTLVASSALATLAKNDLSLVLRSLRPDSLLKQLKHSTHPVH